MSDIAAVATAAPFIPAVTGAIGDAVAANQGTVAAIVGAVIVGVIDGLKPDFLTKAPWLRVLVANVVGGLFGAWAKGRKP